MAVGRHADSDEASNSFGSYAEADFDVDENWHVDFGHAGVFQMSIKQIAEAWYAGALIESTLVWHEGLADWEEALAVPQIARAIGAIVAAPGQAATRYQSGDETDEASSDWDATVVETSRSLGVDPRRPQGAAVRPATNPRGLPPPPNVRAAGVSTVSSSLPPPPDVKAAFETQEWAHSTPPPADPLYAPRQSARDAPRFPPRPFLNETPDAPTTKVIPIVGRAHIGSGLPTRPNPASFVPHPSPAPLAVVRVGAASKPPPSVIASPAVKASSPRLLIWGSLGGAAVGAVLLLLWRLIIPGNTTQETSLNSEPIEQPSAAVTNQKEAPTALPAPADAPAVNAEQPKPPVVEPVPAQAASAPQPDAPADKSGASSTLVEPSHVAAATVPASSARPVPSAVSAPVTKPETRSPEEKHVAQSAAVSAPPAKPEPTQAPKAKPPAAIVVVSNDKSAVAAPSSPAPDESEKAPPAPPKKTEPAASSAAPAPAFDKDAAVATLNTAAAAAARCSGDASGPGTVRVIFSLDGTVHSASIVDGDFEATATGTCVTKAFARCKVPPFSGKPAAVSKHFVVK